MQKLTLTRPDDWHLHLRDGAALAAVLPHTANRFARAIIMPNLNPPVTDTAKAAAYRERILAALPAGAVFEPLMTLYLTDDTTPQVIDEAHRSGIVHGVKLYPAGATTNSAAGVTDIARTRATLDTMASCGMPLLIHGEVNDHAVDPFDRERVFLERVLEPLLDRVPDLKVVLEHVTTCEAVDFVRRAGPRVAATITAHHLLLDRRALFRGGIRPHLYCLPVLKRARHRDALLEAATEGNPKFFLGTDSAPHGRRAKESACGCAGIYTAHAGIELYAEAFEDAGALGQLEAFAAHHGADFYGLPRNTATITLERVDTPVPASFPLGDDDLVPMRAGGTLSWRLAS